MNSLILRMICHGEIVQYKLTGFRHHMFVMLLKNKLLLAPIHEGIQVSIQRGKSNCSEGLYVKLTNYSERP